MPKAFTCKASFLLALAVGMLLASCTNNGEKHRDPGRIYAPDMTYSRACDYYNEKPKIEGTTDKNRFFARKPVEGTVSRNGELPDHMVENDTNAFKAFTTSYRFSEMELKEAGRVYNIHCGVCHGTELNGNGPLYNGGNGKYAAAPANFKLEKYLNMPVGQMYHAVKYGKNAMGSYASQLNVRERWMVIAYIKKFQSENGGPAFAFGDGSVKSATTPSADSAASGNTTAPVGDAGTTAGGPTKPMTRK